MLAAERREERGQNQPSCWVGIVDDDASVRAALERVLRCHGISVETFASAEEYLQRSIVGEPQCVVLDVQLGALSGFHLQDRLASRGAVPPIIFITAQDDIPSALLARRAGACGYLRKPFAPAALVALVKQQLQREGPAGTSA